MVGRTGRVWVRTKLQSDVPISLKQLKKTYPANQKHAILELQLAEQKLPAYLSSPHTV